MIKTENFEQVQVESVEALRTWLAANHSQKKSVWLVTYTKKVPEKYLSREAILDELICFGWIDGIRRKLDEEKTMQLIGPRRAQHWSKSYKLRAAKLEVQGRMHMAGREAIALSKRSGLWNFMDDVDQLIVPDDLQQALDQKEEARQFFNTINPSSKRFVLRWIKLAKSSQTRANRIARVVQLACQGEKLPGS